MKLILVMRKIDKNHKIDILDILTFVISIFTIPALLVIFTFLVIAGLTLQRVAIIINYLNNNV